jgi:predicted nucleic acid-binding protein
MKISLPVPHSIYERAVLLDTSALEAIIDARDRCNKDAIQCLIELRNISYPIYITNLTIAETHRRLLYKPHFDNRLALSFLVNIYDGSVNIVRATEADELKAIGYIERFGDQKLTLTDAVSMAVMIRLRMRKIFSFDWHFRLLGFQIIPPLFS